MKNLKLHNKFLKEVFAKKMKGVYNLMATKHTSICYVYKENIVKNDFY